MKLFNYIMPLLMISTLSYGFQARMARVQERQRVSELIRAIKNAPNLQQVQALNDQVRSLIKDKSYEQDYQALLNTTVSERQAELMAQQPVVTQQAAPEVRPGRRAPQILTNQETPIATQRAQTRASMQKRDVIQAQAVEKSYRHAEEKVPTALINQLENAYELINNKIKIIDDLAKENRFKTTGWLAWIPMLSSINFSKVLAQPDLIMLNRDQIGSLLGAVETNVHEIVAALQTIAKNDKANECNKNPMVRQHVDAIQQKITSLNIILHEVYKKPISDATTNLTQSTATQQIANRELSAILKTSSELVDKIIKHLQHDTPNAFRPTR